jgi:hypothetical protein
MMSPPSSGSDRQVARNKGLAKISAITIGAGAAGVVGALAIAMTLPSPTATTSASSAHVASSLTPAQAGDEGDDDGGSGTTTSTTTPQLQPVAPPASTNIPPVATSGAS